MVDKVEKIWMDGKFVNWDEANVHILTHTLHYGVGAFEGIRSYLRPDGTSVVFRLEEHIQRLMDSLKIVMLKPPFDRDTICRACIDSLRLNRLPEGYIRPLAYVGDGAMGLYAPNNPVRIAVIVWKWGAYLGEEALNKGIRAKVSSFSRHHVNSSMVKGKIVGHYVNSILSKREAKIAGYDEGIMLDTTGYVSEGSGENIFIVKNGTIKTPPFSSAILGGLTRDSVIRMARDLGYRVKPQQFTRDEMWLADEVFMTGTAAEITPVVEIDNRTIGAGVPGPITKAVQKRFFDVVRGQCRDYESWMTPYTVE
ncbi:MAG: branched-chain amino acid transaminase [Deltaproteobacteria bacterium]|nr:branched-chain amino acid transaminase [Deltaproteobacteria bacterium]